MLTPTIIASKVVNNITTAIIMPIKAPTLRPPPSPPLPPLSELCDTTTNYRIK